ncbi:chemotaxis protein [Shewanella maritima]|uniref:chemotaxis protein n=1 Tax=Shewanella maritima TaxID=2520507 RepID=UPI00373621E1
MAVVINRLLQRSTSFFLTIVFMVTSLTGCSLLEVTFENNAEPLSKEQLNMRIFSREFSYRFYNDVERIADEIAANTDDPQIIANTLLWKIHSQQSLQQAIFQASPVAAMIDTWVFTEQMHQFFETGAGQNVFAEQQTAAIEVSKQLSIYFTATAKRFSRNGDYERDVAFVEQFAAHHPLANLSFYRTPSFQEWLVYTGLSETEVITTFGTMPEVLSDISDRMAMTTEQMPKTLGWKAELYSLQASIGPQEIQQALQNLATTSKQFQQLMQQSPELIQQLTVELRHELMPLVNEMSLIADDKLLQLSKEREALSLLIMSERQHISQLISDERDAAMLQLDQMTQNTVNLVFDKVLETIKSVIVYFILFLVMIFFAPLLMGVWLGKRMATKVAAKAT